MRSPRSPEDARDPDALRLKIRASLSPEHRRAISRRQGRPGLASPRLCIASLERVLERFLADILRTP